MIIERIDKIEYIGIKPVYNLTASDTHTYIANGIITHNTGGNVEKVSRCPENHELSGRIWIHYNEL